MWKKLAELLNKIRISMSCCFNSKCSLNENNILDHSIDDKINSNHEEFKPK